MSKRELIPFLRLPCYVEGDEVRFGNGLRQRVAPGEAAMIRAVFEGGSTLAEVAEIGVSAGAASDAAELAARLEADFRSPKNAIGVAAVPLPGDTDILLVEQGYGGVYVHSVELLKKLRQSWRCLLLSPTAPLFEPEELDDVLTLEGLKRDQSGLDYFAWVQIVRTIVKRTRCRLLMLMHRSQSLFLFDLLANHRTVIYCDGYYDGAFRRVHDFRLDATEEHRRSVLEEIYYVVANGQRDFLGIAASPSCNIKILMAGAYSLDAAVENWCWGHEQRESFAHAFRDSGATIRLALPFTDGALFRAGDAAARERRVLFTTTMHNIHEKGFPELVDAMSADRAIRARVVVRQPERLPEIPKGVAGRMEIGGVTKHEMIDLYHSLWVNCRTSRSESSPVSILESMSCELPQIVSPKVAQQIPIIEDGVTGFVVDPDDRADLTRALRTILDDQALRDRMGRECRRRACELAYERRVGEFERLLA